MSQINDPWNLFESAPKDGTHVLMWCNGIISEAWWRKDILGKYVWGGNGWSYPEWDKPQAWMFKPKPPAAPVADSGELTPE